MIVAKTTFDLRVVREIGRQFGYDLSVEEKDGAESLKVLQLLFPNQEGLLRHISLSFILVLEPLQTVHVLTNIKGLIANLVICPNNDLLILTATLEDWVYNIQRGSKEHDVLKLHNIVYNILVDQGYKFLFKDYYKDKASWPDLFKLTQK